MEFDFSNPRMDMSIQCPKTVIIEIGQVKPREYIETKHKKAEAHCARMARGRRIDAATITNLREKVESLRSALIEAERAGINA